MIHLDSQCKGRAGTTATEIYPEVINNVIMKIQPLTNVLIALKEKIKHAALNNKFNRNGIYYSKQDI